MKETIHLTQAQYDELIRRKKQIIEEERPRIAEQIDIARGFGDLSENAEYHAAKEEQGQLETELQNIERTIKFAKIIKHSGKNDVVELGNEITIKSLNGDNEEYKFTLIGQDGNGVDEVDIGSKLGASLLGKRVGDTFSYEANESSLGILSFKINTID
ncbi:GreA/GreB family elongation factor [Bacillus mexicanus]|uniref:GreA/GreB family elongation factor n=1 Tax=Bacillus mexicanus TaxID=2834415 RepID=UPI003D1DE7C1